MKHFLFRCLYFLQVHHLIRYLWRDKGIILMYHGFTDRKVHEGIENYQGKHLHVERFRSQLEYLKKYHRIVSLDQLVDSYSSSKTAPSYCAVITIDDGYRSNYTLAFPILRQLRVPATIFLTTSFVENKEPLWMDRIEYAINKANPNRFEFKVYSEGNKASAIPVEFDDRKSRVESERRIRTKLKTTPQEFRSEIIGTLEERLERRIFQDPAFPEIYQPLEWSDIKEMIESGLISAGSHSHTHAVLTRCEPETLRRELGLSREIIEKRTASRCQLFCYPNGNIGDFNEGTKRILKEAGYVCALTTVPGVNDRRSDLFEMKRVGVPYQGDLVEFVMYLYGVAQFFSNIKQTFLKLMGFRNKNGSDAAN